MQLWLTPRPQPNTRIHPPTVCPQPGCGGRRFHLHQVVAKDVRDTPAVAASAAASSLGLAGRSTRVQGTRQTTRPTTATAAATVMRMHPVPHPPVRRRVSVHRYTCCRCRRTFRMYPAGVERGGVSVGVQRLAAALHLLGLSFRDVSRALGLLGVALGKSRAHALVAPRLRGLARRGVAPLLTRVEVAEVVETAVEGAGAATGQPGAWIWIHGRQLALRRAVDRRGRAALVVDGIDRDTYQAVERWVRGTLTGFGVDVDVVFPAPGSRRRRAMLGGLEVGLDVGLDVGTVVGLDEGSEQRDAAIASGAGEGGRDAGGVTQVRVVANSSGRPCHAQHLGAGLAGDPWHAGDRGRAVGWCCDIATGTRVAARPRGLDRLARSTPRLAVARAWRERVGAVLRSAGRRPPGLRCGGPRRSNARAGTGWLPRRLLGEG